MDFGSACWARTSDPHKDALQADRDAFEAEKRTHSIDRAIDDAIATHRGIRSLIAPAIRDQVMLTDDGTVVVKDPKTGEPMLTEDGDQTTVSDFVLTLQKDPDMGGAFYSRQRSGAGSHSTGGGGGGNKDTSTDAKRAAIENKPPATRTAAERLELFRLQGKIPRMDEA